MDWLWIVAGVAVYLVVGVFAMRLFFKIAGNTENWEWCKFDFESNFNFP